MIAYRDSLGRMQYGKNQEVDPNPKPKDNPNLMTQSQPEENNLDNPAPSGKTMAQPKPAQAKPTEPEDSHIPPQQGNETPAYMSVVVDQINMHEGKLNSLEEQFASMHAMIKIMYKQYEAQNKN